MVCTGKEARQIGGIVEIFEQGKLITQYMYSKTAVQRPILPTDAHQKGSRIAYCEQHDIALQIVLKCGCITAVMGS